MKDTVRPTVPAETPREPTRKDTRPWPVPIAPEELAAAIFRAADRQRDARVAQEASEPSAAD